MLLIILSAVEKIASPYIMIVGLIQRLIIYNNINEMNNCTMRAMIINSVILESLYSFQSEQKIIEIPINVAGIEAL